MSAEPNKPCHHHLIQQLSRRKPQVVTIRHPRWSPWLHRIIPRILVGSRRGRRRRCRRVYGSWSSIRGTYCTHKQLTPHCMPVVFTFRRHNTRRFRSWNTARYACNAVNGSRSCRPNRKLAVASRMQRQRIGMDSEQRKCFGAPTRTCQHIDYGTKIALLHLSVFFCPSCLRAWWLVWRTGNGVGRIDRDKLRRVQWNWNLAGLPSRYSPRPPRLTQPGHPSAGPPSVTTGVAGNIIANCECDTTKTGRQTEPVTRRRIIHEAGDETKIFNHWPRNF